MHTSTCVTEEEFKTLLDTAQRKACDPWYSKANAPAHWGEYYSQGILECCIQTRGYNYQWLSTSPHFAELLEELNNILIMVHIK